MNCARVKAAVSGFEKEFAGKLRVHTVSVETPEGKEAVKKYDFQTHGLVVYDPARQLIYKRRDHMARAEEVHELLMGLFRPGQRQGGA